MISYYANNNGLVKIDNWQPHCWVSIENPNDEERKYLIEKMEIPEAFYNDIEDVDERPRIEYEDGWFLIILRLPYKSNDKKVPYYTVPLGLVFKEDKFYSICFYQTDVIPDFVNYTKRKCADIRDNFDLVLKLILSSSVWFLKYLKQINLNIKVAESELERSIRNKELQTLMRLEKCLVFFTTSLKGNHILVHKLKNLKDYKDTYDEELLEDVEIELRQALDMTNIYSDILSGMMDAYASVISNNLNVIMKRLTSISIILMIPTLIASFFGMNVPNSFENHEFAFLIILLISFLISGAALIFFMKRKWF